ncbi:MAG: FlgD immunoglobulin-like domain containing protein, partial [Candidatus Eiseniibacteriota bacterium]
GNTVLVGGYGDNVAAGAAWVYTRSGGVWSQQGAKLVGTGAVGNAEQGWSVALSADGNTAIVCGYADNGYVGAAWVYTRSGGVWSQQGAKLVGTGNTGSSGQGYSVALSSDGNTAIIGAAYDNTYTGAAWVFTRSGSTWSQQGGIITGAGEAGAGNFGSSVALSADGNTAIAGGWADNSYLGAAWVYVRVGGMWSAQGGKLVGTGYVGTDVEQGSDVALSADGNTAIVGGDQDGAGAGATWVYTRSGATWSQHGSKLFGSGANMIAYQGCSVAISADGGTALIGGTYDGVGTGAAWVFIDPAILAVEPQPHLSGLALAAPFPNPSAGQIAITYSLPHEAIVTLAVFDISGRAVRTLVSGATAAGEHSMHWDGQTSAGRSAPGGLYFISLKSGADQVTRRFVLAK